MRESRHLSGRLLDRLSRRIEWNDVVVNRGHQPQFNQRNTDRERRGVAAGGRDAAWEVPLLRGQWVSECDPASAPGHVKDKVGNDTQPDKVEIVKDKGVGDQHRHHKDVVEALSVLPERCVHVRDERAEDDRDKKLRGEEASGEKGVKRRRREGSPRRTDPNRRRDTENYSGANRQQYPVKNVVSLVHDRRW